MNGFNADCGQFKGTFRNWNHRFKRLIRNRIFWNRFHSFSVFFGVSIILFVSPTSTDASQAIHTSTVNRLLITDLTGKQKFEGLSDNSLETAVVISSLNSSSAGLLIDLGVRKTIHRIHLIGSNARLNYWSDSQNVKDHPPRGMINVIVGESLDKMDSVASYLVPYDAGEPIDIEAEIRFWPVSGRYIKLEMKSAKSFSSLEWWQANWPTKKPSLVNGWRIAELTVNGFAYQEGQANQDAVVLPEDATEPLRLAADDLSYYLTEMLGRPIKVVTPGESGKCTGLLFYLVDLRSLAPDYQTMMENIKRGHLPQEINIERHGREVRFQAWPHRNVLLSVWEFLRLQGVQWFYPGSYGEYIPHKKKLDLSFLPLKSDLPLRRNFAIWEVNGFLPWRMHVKQTLRQEYLNIWRSGWTGNWNIPSFLSSDEVPQFQFNKNDIESSYSHQFGGYPHNFGTVIPERILREHPQWCGYSEEKRRRICPPEEGAPMFDLTNPEVIQWVADKIIAGEHLSPINISTFHKTHFEINKMVRLYNLLPMDAVSFDQSIRSKYLNTPLIKRQVSNGFYEYSQSGSYYYFINEVARLVKSKNPQVIMGALAYADVWDPPPNIKVFFDNIKVEVCMYGSPNLPIHSFVNQDLHKRFLEWRKKLKFMETYDYVLLHTDYWQQDPQMPVALVAGIVDRAKFLASIDALGGGTQASPLSYSYNPWNFFAYNRIRQNTALTPEQILNEFFHGYFQESAEPMLAYYLAIQEYQLKYNVDMRFLGKSFCYSITPGSYPNSLLAEMKKHLESAENMAINWFVKARIANIREGFLWLIAKRQLEGVDLSDTSIYANVRENPFRLDLSQGTQTILGTWGNGAGRRVIDNKTCWIFWGHGAMHQALFFSRTGKYQIRIKARSIASKKTWPTMKVYVGPFCIGINDVVSEKNEDKEYVFEVDIPPKFGVQDFLVLYENDAIGEQREIVIKEVLFTPLPEKKH